MIPIPNILIAIVFFVIAGNTSGSAADDWRLWGWINLAIAAVLAIADPEKRR